MQIHDILGLEGKLLTYECISLITQMKKPSGEGKCWQKLTAY